MKLILSAAFALLATAAFAQNAKNHSARRFRLADTAGMGQYVMRLYDTRIYKALPATAAPAKKEGE